MGLCRCPSAQGRGLRTTLTLKEPFPYLILDARYEPVREDGIIASRAVLIAIGVD